MVKLHFERDHGEPKKLPVHLKSNEDRIDEYLKKQGFRPLQRAKIMSHHQIVEQVKLNLGIK